MVEPIIHDLDGGDEPREIVRLGGKDLDVSFIPAGLAIRVTRAYTAWLEHSMPIIEAVLKDNPDVEDELKLQEMINGIVNNDDELLEENNRLQIKLVSVFLLYHDEQYTPAWIAENMDTRKVGFLVGKIIAAVNTGKVPGTMKTGRALFEDRIQQSKKKGRATGNGSSVNSALSTDIPETISSGE